MYMYMCVRLFVYVCMLPWMVECVCVCVRVCVCSFACVSLCLCAWVYVSFNVCFFACTYVWVCVRLFAYVCMLPWMVKCVCSCACVSLWVYKALCSVIVIVYNIKIRVRTSILQNKNLILMQYIRNIRNIPCFEFHKNTKVGIFCLSQGLSAWVYVSVNVCFCACLYVWVCEKKGKCRGVRRNENWENKWCSISVK